MESRLLDCTAGILDGVIVKFSKDLDGRDHLVIIERFRSALIKHEDALKHGGRGASNSCLDRIFVVGVVLVVVIIRDSQIVGVQA